MDQYKFKTNYGLKTVSINGAYNSKNNFTGSVEVSPLNDSEVQVATELVDGRVVEISYQTEDAAEVARNILQVIKKSAPEKAQRVLGPVTKTLDALVLRN